MYVKDVVVQNQVGLHARPATFFIQKANEYKSSIWVEKEDRRGNAKSLLGVLSEEACFTDESHFSGLLEYPQYTRPAEWEGRAVPDILLTGHHANIQAWRRQQSLERTLRRRPDMLEHAELTPKERLFLEEQKRQTAENTSQND